MATLAADQVPAFATGRLRATMLVGFVLLYSVLAERLFLQMDTGGRGVLPILPLLAGPLAAVLVVFASRGRDLTLFRERRFWLGCGIYASVSIALPALAIVDAAYSTRALFACLEGITAICMVLIGFALGRSRQGRQQMQGAIFTATMIHAACAVMQFLNVAGLSAAPLISSLSKWDQAAQSAYSDTYVLYGRSIGLYLNPNVLGLWSVLAFWACSLLLRGRRRVIGAIAALVSLVLSQSRGSIAALLATIALLVMVAILKAMARRRISRTGVRVLAIFSASFLLVTALLMTSDLSNSSSLGRLSIVDNMVERFQSGWTSLSTGSASDDNLRARVDVWSKAMEFLRDRPWGTMGPPQVEFGYSIDNEYVRVALQGGGPFVLALLLSLGSLALLLRRHEVEARFVGIASCAVAVNAWTALPMNTAPMAVVWVFFGIALARMRASKHGDPDEALAVSQPADVMLGAPPVNVAEAR